jgi:hypothetical protein
MNFARFVSPEPDDEGLFEPGCVYVLDNNVRGVEVDDQAAILVRGRRVEVPFSDKRFRFLKDVHAIWLGTGPKLGDVPGAVVKVDGVDEGGLYVVGRGFVQAKHLRIVDHQILRPGVWLMDKYTGKWARVRMVDNTDCVCVSEKSATRRPLVEFVFPVCTGGEFLERPVVVCKDSFLAEEGLEEGMSYPLEEGWPGGAGMVVVSVEGSSERALANRFLWPCEISEKIT